MTVPWRSAESWRFADRRQAGAALARQLQHFADKPDVVVLALPRGGVPVAYEVARALGAPMDVFVVRKLGMPGHPELAMGAIASGGVRVMNEDVVTWYRPSASAIEAVTRAELAELERRERAYRDSRPPLPVEGRTVILVDDGLATGSTMRAAVLALRRLRPSRVVVAVPVGARETCEALRAIADEVVCALMPEPFSAVGLWYIDFDQTTDDEVRQLLSTQGADATQHAERVMHDTSAIDTVRRYAVPVDLESAAQRLLEAIDPDVSLVLIGEATHGTLEFYRIRADLTRALIRQRGFNVVAVEADWPDAYRANQWVRLFGTDNTAEEALADFTRFPRWMWRNREVVRFLRWLRSENAERRPDARAGFYGLDLYSLHRSIARVIEYLDKVDPNAAKRARQGYACFDAFGEDVQRYGYTASLNIERSCEDEVVEQLVDLRRRAAEYARRDGRIAADEYFVAEQNAQVVRDAETYYRAMFRGGAESWNVRDRHMMTTLKNLLDHAGRAHETPRAVVWAHNSHLGDARATSMSDIGELNLGQLVRERFGSNCCSIGMTTHEGEVTAAHEWDEPAALRTVRTSLPGSYERVFHDVGMPAFTVRLLSPEVASALAGPRLERAIGVIYRPETERASHYFAARLPQQFDLVVHVDRTRAVEPLERWGRHEVDLPETYPTGV